MLSIAAYAAPLAAREDEGGLEPGIFSALARLVSGLGRARERRLDMQLAAFVEANGGQLTDDIERRMGTGFTTGRF